MSSLCVMLVLLSAPASEAKPGEAPAPNEAKPAAPVGSVVRARLVLSAAVPAPRAILPYKRALVADVYEIVETLAGPLGQPTVKLPRRVLVARWAISDGAVLPAAPPLRGWRTHRLTLTKFDDRKELAREKLILADTEEFDLPLYFVVSGR